MKKPSKIESIQDETMFAALSAEESLEVVGGIEAATAAGGCKLTVSCTFSGSGDTATVSDQISF